MFFNPLPSHSVMTRAIIPTLLATPLPKRLISQHKSILILRVFGGKKCWRKNLQKWKLTLENKESHEHSGFLNLILYFIPSYQKKIRNSSLYSAFQPFQKFIFCHIPCIFPKTSLSFCISWRYKWVSPEDTPCVMWQQKLVCSSEEMCPRHSQSIFQYFASFFSDTWDWIWSIFF